MGVPLVIVILLSIGIFPSKNHPFVAGWWCTYPSEKYMSSSVGMMTFPTEWKNKNHVPNHQGDINIDIY